MSRPDAVAAPQRRALRVRGAVQGVGFRPFVYRLALDLGLQGWVLNDAEGVLLEARGSAAALDALEHRLRSDAPPLARVASVSALPCGATDVADQPGFRILPSRGGVVRTVVPPDTATCADCLAELFDPADRRHRHAFINCTQCGPRYTLTRALPYDRAQTSMAAFTQCPACAREYADPTHRRFHAEPNACPDCGPTLALVGSDGTPLDAGADVLTATLARLLDGQIVALKGLGGFHLACDARNAAAVARLRQRKQREAKPFAVMAAGLASARLWVHADDGDAALLAAPERPIVLLPRRAKAPDALAGVAPGLHTLGLMLPCTPLQFLLFHEAAGRPAGTAWLEQEQPLLLVMTSANPGGEPLVRGNDEALRRLQDLADAWLLHDRDIVARCDDSVLVGATRADAPDHRDAPTFVRRARGWTPRAVRLGNSGPSVLATGAWLKNTVCLTRGDEAFLSPHIGSLDNAATCEALQEMVDHLGAVLDVRPQAVAHDLHEDFFSTRFARAWAASHDLPALAVQHHHAHVAAVAAEHGAQGPLLGLALDGVGLGSDGAAWGGELLRVDGAGFERLGHLAPLALPGGDMAARQPWRLAAAVLHALGRGDEIEGRFAAQAGAGAVAQMLARGLRCPPTTSAGRWFDAAAALLGLCPVNAYEAQAAMQLQALAESAGRPAAAGATATMALRDDGVLDPLPVLAALADARDAAAGAAHFHEALAEGLARWVSQAAARSGLRRVALAGGCLLNRLLARRLLARLQADGLQVLQARQVPPNDGAIALGQAWVARCRLRQGD